ncbi:MAG: pyrroline-5-carboxylate reductase [Actinomycetota bacterium]|nr:pyrroline-5-carboxylate reductase [Actinomycetota bacterium]
MEQLALIGCGKMGEALLSGLIGSGWADRAELAVVEPSDSRRDALAARYPGVGLYSAPQPFEAAVLAVKPPEVQAACTALAEASTATERVLSIVAGVGSARIAEWLRPGTAVVRAMPNVAALVGSSATALAGGPGSGESDMEWAESVMAAVGESVRVDESLLDAVTGLSGSGPAYLLLVVEAMTEAGVHAGLSRDQSAALVHGTFAGVSALVDRSGQTPEALRAAVTSPAGTTAAGIRVLEDRATRAAFMAAVQEAAARSAELGRSG